MPRRLADLRPHPSVRTRARLVRRRIAAGRPVTLGLASVRTGAISICLVVVSAIVPLSMNVAGAAEPGAGSAAAGSAAAGSAGTRATGTRVLPERPAGVRQPSPLYQRLQRQANKALGERRAAYEKLKTAADIAAWQQARRQIFLETLGPLPERGELRAQTVGTLAGDGFRVEKVLFESRPGHHVAGNLYLPLTPGPHPAAIVPCGHSFNGKAADGYQRVSKLLACNGVAALCYDPIGQGERYQTFGADQRPLGGNYQGGASSVAQLAGIPGGPKFNPVEEHTLIGISSILVGANTATYRIWDGMRAIDYLASRADIDAKRIGCTGNSGGGTLTAYLMALDERIVAAAPTCYLTSFERLLATAGPQDAEQNLFGQLSRGLDEADYVLMRAPKPTLLCAGTRDATFDIAGTWDILRDAKRVYGRLGYAERVDIAEADEPHGFTKPLREAATRWLVRWLVGKDQAIFEPEWKAYTATELQCSPRGQVMFLAQERSVFDFNRDEANRLAPRRKAAWAAQSPAERIATVRRVAGIREGAPWNTTVEVVATERFPGFERRKLVLKRDDGVELPGLLYLPESPRPDAAAVLYVDSQGKQAGAAMGGACESAARGGQLVLAFDPQGLGETLVRHPRDWGRELFGPNTQEFFLAYMLGQSLVGLHAEDILAAAQFLSRFGEPPAPRLVSLDARGTAAQLAALHARFVEPVRFAAAVPAAYNDLPRSWTELLDSPAAGDRLPLAIHAVLASYELADLGR